MEGINNLGATCAINSLIQMICRCQRLRDVILNSNTGEGTFTNELKEIIDLIYNQKKSLNPMKFIDNFYITFKGVFNRFEQLDINELWFYVFDKINDETSISLESDLDEYESKIAVFNNNKTSDILKLVQGVFINIISCSNCGHKSHSFEPFITIPVDIYENKSIADLVGLAIDDEIREQDEWKCENCNGNHKYLKMKKIWKLPDILFISLNRFKDVNNKNNTEVYINENLNFNLNNIRNYNYNLQSIGLHFGNLQGGHYISVCNINNETFNIYNDEIVRVINKDEFIQNHLKNNTAYLILYELNRSL